MLDTLEDFAPGAKFHGRLETAFDALGPLSYRPIAPKLHDITVKKRHEEFHLRFKLWEIMHGSSRSVRRLIITHAGVPTRFRRRGIFTRTLDRLVAKVRPDEVEIEAVMGEEIMA